MRNKVKRLILKLYFKFYASRIFSRILMPLLFKLEKFLPYKFSFSQFGEDQLFHNLEKKHGTYVEIGCNHPILASNSFRLYLNGWTGLVIDGNALYQKFWNSARPKDKFIKTLIAAESKKDTPFYEHYAGYVSTAVEEHAEKFDMEDFNLTYRDSQNINEVLLQNDIHDFDILFIDIEGMDFEVLCSLDLTIYQPKYIAIEDHEYSHEKGNDFSQISRYLLNNGYFLQGMMSPSYVYERFSDSSS